MSVSIHRLVLVLASVLALSGCANTLSQSPQAAVADDEAVCSQAGAPGSNAYVACLKERDVARESQQRRMDRTHQRLTEDMLNRR